jgi:hypothetical protein
VANLSWRWTFYLGIVINALALLLVTVFYWPPDFVELHPEGKTRFGQFKELDFVGLFLFGGGLTCFLLGISFGGNPYPWRSAIVVAPTVIGGKSHLKPVTFCKETDPTTRHCFSRGVSTVGNPCTENHGQIVSSGSGQECPRRYPSNVSDVRIRDDCKCI